MTRPYGQYDPYKVFEWIVDYKYKHDGNSPTLREIARGCKITSLCSTWSILRRLVKLELIENFSRGKHGIYVIGGRWTFTGDIVRKRIRRGYCSRGNGNINHYLDCMYGEYGTGTRVDCCGKVVETEHPTLGKMPVCENHIEAAQAGEEK